MNAHEVSVAAELPNPSLATPRVGIADGLPTGTITADFTGLAGELNPFGVDATRLSGGIIATHLPVDTAGRCAAIRGAPIATIRRLRATDQHKQSENDEPTRHNKLQGLIDGSEASLVFGNFPTPPAALRCAPAVFLWL